MMRIKVLIENTTAPDMSSLKSQHGISLYLETRGKKLLFDTGQNHFFLDNAREMGVSLEEVEQVIVSHDHYDHGGGLESFLQANSQGTVFLSSQCFQPHYARREGGELKYIGLDPKIVTRHKERCHFISQEYCSISPHLYVLANTRFEGFRPRGNQALVIKDNGAYRQDDFMHERMLVAAEPDGDVIITGCSHNGITNMLASYRDRFPHRPVKALLGGFHLADPFTGRMLEPEEDVRALAEALEIFGVKAIFTGHCTGEEAFRLLRAKWGDTLQLFQTGQELEL